MRRAVIYARVMGGSISEEQVALLREHCPHLKAVTVMLDGNEAGRKAAGAVALSLARHWWVRLAELPEGEQPDTASVPMLNVMLRRPQPEAA